MQKYYIAFIFNALSNDALNWKETAKTTATKATHFTVDKLQRSSSCDMRVCNVITKKSYSSSCILRFVVSLTNNFHSLGHLFVFYEKKKAGWSTKYPKSEKSVSVLNTLPTNVKIV